MLITDSVIDRPTATPIHGPAFDAVDGEAHLARCVERGRAFLTRVDTILDDVRSRRELTERLGKVNDETMAAMIEAGFFRSFTPTQFGGLEIDPASFFDGLIRLAQADSSAAWVAGQLNIHAIQVALMDKRFQQEFWGKSPDTRASSSFAPLGRVRPAEGGYVLDGTWTFSSGVDHAQWAILGGGDRSFLVPRSDFSVDDDSWDVQGLRGTGSKALTLRDVYVPEYRCMKYVDTFNDANPGWEINNRPLYWLSFPGLFFSAATNTAIGTALDGVNTFIEQTRSRRTRQGTGDPMSGNPFMQVKLARAITRMEDVRRRHLDNWRRMFEQVCRGERPSTVERMRVRFESADANATSYEVMQDLWPMAGAAASANSNHLQTVMRHLMAARNHGTAGVEFAAGGYMQALFGTVPKIEPAQLNLGTLLYVR